MQKIVMKYVPSMLEEVQLKSCEEIKENLEICVFVQVGIWASDKYVIWMVQISPKSEIVILCSDAIGNLTQNPDFWMYLVFRSHSLYEKFQPLNLCVYVKICSGDLNTRLVWYSNGR